jgi:hypothetical protein
MLMTGRQRRTRERGQALILALVVLALLGAFSVAILHFASSVQTTVASTRQAAYRDSLGDAAALAARDLVAQGLGCPDPVAPVQATTKFVSSAETVSVTPDKWTSSQQPAPPACTPGSGGNGADPGTYCLDTVSAWGNGQAIYATVRILVNNNGGASIAHIHYENTSSYTC